MTDERGSYSGVQTTDHFPGRSTHQLGPDIRHNLGPATTIEPLYDTIPLEKSVHAPRGWPASAGSVRSSAWSIIGNTAVDVILFICSVAFLTFALIVNSYDQAPTAEHRVAVSRLLEATKYGPTVFPILFAAVVGRATHAVLLWRLERGDYIGVLDLLAGSTSLTSTITSQLKLRIISFFGISLIVLWALSPIGGQASFRQMSFGNHITVQPSPFNYFVSVGSMDLYGDSDRTVYYSIVNSLYLASIVAPKSVKSSPRDTWGNVKIPLIEHYEQASTSDDQGWFTMHDEVQSNESTTYSSLVGIPISGLNASGFINYDMNLETMYLRLNCPVYNVSDWVIPHDAKNATGMGASFWWYDNTTMRGLDNIYDSHLPPFNFSYTTWGMLGMSQCTLTTTYVEAQVSCPIALNCSTSKIRRSRLKHPPTAHTQLDYPSYGGYGNWYLFVYEFVTAIGGHPATPTLAEEYLTLPNDPTQLLQSPSWPEPFSNETFAIRLGQLMNTYWTCTQGLYVIPGSIFPEQGAHGNTTGSKSSQQEVMIVSKGWVIALCIASIIMIAASLMSPIVHYVLTRGPDLMCNISSLATQNNPHISLPLTGTFMDAGERARLLKSTKVRLGDIDHQCEIGILAIASVNRDEYGTIDAIKKGRLYL